MAKILKTKITLLFIIFCTINCRSQDKEIYFSTTGDTVLYSFGDGTPIYNGYSDTVGHIITIAAFNPKDTLKILSSFKVTTVKHQRAFDLLSVDTLNKYHLSYDGVRIYEPDKNIKLKTEFKNIKFFSLVDNSTDSIFTADVIITLKCKSKLIREETVKFMFQGPNKESHHEATVCYVTLWKKENKDKYLIFYQIKRNIIITKSGYGSRYDISKYIDYY